MSPPDCCFPQLNPMESGESNCLIDLDEEWVLSLKKKVRDAALRTHRRNNPPTIFRVPANMREADPDAYMPKIISLGPYHRNNPALEPMEELKLRYLQKLLLRNPDFVLDDYIKLIKGLEAEARSSYSEDIDMGSDSFVEMLLLDGCFIVELFLMQVDGNKDDDDDESKGSDEEDDPILTTTWTTPLIEYDMLMLENQIPFFILGHIYDLVTEPSSHRGEYYAIIQLAQAFFNDYLPTDRLVVPSEDVVPKFYHLLHFFHSCIMPEEYQKKTQSETDQFDYKPLIYHKLVKKTRTFLPTPGSVPNATRLKEAGVVFRKKKKANSFLDIEFRNGVMEIPTLKIYDQTNSLFHNLIAFEQCFPKVGTYFVTYAMMMDCLIGTAEDVALLHRYGCVVSGLGNDDDAARLFNRLRKDATIDYKSCYLAGIFEDVKRHCDSRWNKWRAKLMHDYFSNPWSVLSLIAALVLIFLTFIQASFAVVAYVWPPH